MMINNNGERFQWQLNLETAVTKPSYLMFASKQTLPTMYANISLGYTTLNMMITKPNFLKTRQHCEQ